MSQDASGSVDERTFPRPPQSFVDSKERSIEIRAGCPREALVKMYDDFSPDSRAQGLPPATTERIEEWLDILDEGLNVVAWDVKAETAAQPSSEKAETANQPSSENAETAAQSKIAGQTGSKIAIGHACLLDCGNGTYELTIFVHHEYQLAGIGSQLIRTLLGHGQENDVEHVWLSVERSNHVAMNLYRSVGFETTSAAGLEHEMELYC